MSEALSPFAQFEQERIVREQEREDYWQERREALAAQIEAAQEAEQAAGQALGPLGQPILVGHHSEKSARARHKSYLAKASKTAELIRKYEHATAKWQAASRATAARYTRTAISNKVASLTAQLKKNPANAEALEDELAYWRHHLDMALGQDVTPINRQTVKVGDLVRVKTRWYMVARVNPKTVTVWFDKERGVTSDWRPKYEAIDEHKAIPAT